jgi:hypothetical protein
VRSNPALLVVLALPAAVACASPRVGDSHATPQPPADTAATPDPDAGDGPPFAGCTAMYTTVIGWSIDCGVTTVLTREGEEPDLLLRAARTSMRGAFSGPVEEHFEPVTVGGAERRGLHLMIKTKGVVVAMGTAAIVESDAAPMRLVACLAGADPAAQTRCQRQLDLLAATSYGAMPPDGVRIKARPRPAIAGRPFDAPAECQVAANDRTGLVDCGDAVLGWAEPTDPKTVGAARDAAIDDMVHHMHEKFPNDPSPTRSAGGCRIEGIAASCVVAKWRDFKMTAGTASVRGHSIVAWCMAREGATPTICSDSVK